MPKIRFKDLNEAELALIEIEEMCAGEKAGNTLTPARTLLPLVAAVKKLTEEVQMLKIKSNYTSPPMIQ